jgi:hypothetical protein
MFDKKHSDETRRKMSGAAQRRWARTRKEKADNGHRMLMAAIVRQAVKDKVAWFLETETGRGYCAVAGIDLDTLPGGKA